MSDPRPKNPMPPETRLFGILSSIVEVKQRESLPLLASMLWIFLALTAYYIIKPLRSAVLQEKIGVDNKWVALIITTLFVAGLAYGYGKVVPRVSRAKLIIWTFIVFVLCLAGFAILLPRGEATVGYAFFVWVSTFNLMIVSQFWSLATEVWTKQQGLRLFGMIGVGGVSGGIFGTIVVARFAKTLSTEQMLLVSAGVLLVCLLLALYILRIGARTQTEAPSAVSVPSQSQKTDLSDAGNAAWLVLRSPYLRLIALMMLILNLVNTNNEWIMDKVVSEAGLASDQLREFYAQFYLYQNVITFGIQLFLTARIQRRFGAKVALAFEPVVGIVGGLLFMFAPVLAVIRWHKILENATDYSIQSNTKELLYLPLTPLEKYSAKNFNDTFVVRGGDALGAASIFLFTSVLIPALGAWGLRVMIGIDVLLGAVWLALVIRIGNMHRARMETGETKAG